MDKRCINVKQAADVLGSAVIRHHIEKGTLSVVRYGRRALVPVAEFETLLASLIPNASAHLLAKPPIQSAPVRRRSWARSPVAPINGSGAA